MVFLHCDQTHVQTERGARGCETLEGTSLNSHTNCPRTRKPPAPASRSHRSSGLVLTKVPICLVLTSLSCSSCLWPRRRRYSMCITSIRGMLAFFRNSACIRGKNPGFSLPARRNCLYKLKTCFWSLLCRAMVYQEDPLRSPGRATAGKRGPTSLCKGPTPAVVYNRQKIIRTACAGNHMNHQPRMV